jgi:polyphosphate kinase 2 (PPK2 family)
MGINLTDYESDQPFQGDYFTELVALQSRLSRIQAAHIMHNHRSIILFEGWDASGKGGIIQRLTGEWDPRYFRVWPIAAPTLGEKERHFLWRFWQRMPGNREIAIFDRSWYGRVLVERVEGFANDQQWRRAYDEINEFEAQQLDCGTTIIKLFLHVTQKTQDKRLKDRIENPWKRWKTGEEDYRNRARRNDYLKAYSDMFDHTDTRWAPWHVVDGNNKKQARLNALRYIADRLETAVSMIPLPADPKLIELAERELDVKLEIE